MYKFQIVLKIVAPLMHGLLDLIKKDSKIISLYAKANKALYLSKDNGRNRVTIYNS
ncbi:MULTISPECIES: hypothetical protein [unclassified Sulfurimonas]|uniref:hypothetical protein n=1 Tax=unclassified Sulfurimonas TaxID=2623549 RepID=UPI0025E9EC95|nr:MULTISPECIES: hypothetical protein [unclassified Sulfurimonas]